MSLNEKSKNPQSEATGKTESKPARDPRDILNGLPLAPWMKPMSEKKLFIPSSLGMREVDGENYSIVITRGVAEAIIFLERGYEYKTVGTLRNGVDVWRNKFDGFGDNDLLTYMPHWTKDANFALRLLAEIVEATGGINIAADMETWEKDGLYLMQTNAFLPGSEPDTYGALGCWFSPFCMGVAALWLSVKSQQVVRILDNDFEFGAKALMDFTPTGEHYGPW